MKTKKKIIALVEIAVVLCSVFLVALPTIAAEQTTQEVSASDVTTASEDNYVLGIYGNANEDDTIDMRDLTYVKLIFFGKKPETELADAKYDGKINPLDFIQIKLVIVGKEKELTVIDSYEKIVTVKKPVNRIVVVRRCALETLRTLKVSKDKIVGVEDIIQYSGEGKWGVDYKIFFPEFQDIPTVGVTWTPDIEVILSLKPDVVFLVPSSRVDSAVDTLESAGIPALRSLCKWDPSGVGRLDPSELADPSGLKVYSQELRQLGYIFDKKNEAEVFIDWLDGAMNPIFKGSETIPEESKPKVYHEGSFGTWQTYSAYAYIELSGGKNIFEEMSGDIDPEAVIERDPDIIVKVAPAGEVTGYHLDVGDTAEILKIKEEMMSRDILQNVVAVKKGRIYVISSYLTSSGPASASRGFLQVIYQAKWFHPELFEDLDPKAIHQEYLTRFQGLDTDLDEKCVFVYPEPS